MRHIWQRVSLVTLCYRKRINFRVAALKFCQILFSPSKEHVFWCSGEFWVFGLPSELELLSLQPYYLQFPVLSPVPGCYHDIIPQSLLCASSFPSHWTWLVVPCPISTQELQSCDPLEQPKGLRFSWVVCKPEEEGVRLAAAALPGRVSVINLNCFLGSWHSVRSFRCRKPNAMEKHLV